MITFTEGELRCILITLVEYKANAVKHGYVPQWIDELHNKLSTATSAYKPHVLVPANEYKERVDTTDEEGWVQQCKCGKSFVTRARTGQCPQCGMGYEILKNREEITA